MENISSDFAIKVLQEDADRIKLLIRNQTNSLCISQCKAFEEVVDTQMYGFSRQVFFAEKVGILNSSGSDGCRLGGLTLANEDKETTFFRL